ncbi:hypothetical protein ACPAVH_31055 [Enterobacteriaceae bacterium TYF_5]
MTGADRTVCGCVTLTRTSSARLAGDTEDKKSVATIKTRFFIMVQFPSGSIAR